MDIVKFLILLFITGIIAFYNHRTGKIPDTLIFPAFLVAVILRMSEIYSTDSFSPAFEAFGGAGIICGILLILLLVFPGSIGGGDFKFGIVAGFFLNYSQGLILLGVLFGVGFIAMITSSNKIKLKKKISSGVLWFSSVVVLIAIEIRSASAVFTAIVAVIILLYFFNKTVKEDNDSFVKRD
jgi:type IV leader peptidase family protein